MPLEIEAKFRVESHEPLRERLRALGAERLGRVLEANAIFDRRGGSLRGSGCGLRVRSTIEDGSGQRTATMTFKGPVLAGSFKSREELEVRVSDAETASHILHALGFVRILWYQKRRESWRLDRCRIELDEPPHIGLFVEVEGPGETAIRSLQEKLGLGEAPHVRGSYVRMLSEYCDKHGVTDGVLRLPDSQAPPM